MILCDTNEINYLEFKSLRRDSYICHILIFKLGSVQYIFIYSRTFINMI